jgi:HK97 family phage prohead protease
MNFDAIADAFLRGEQLDQLTPEQRRAVGLIATGASADRELEAAGVEFVRGMKASKLGRLGWATTGPVQRAEGDLGPNRLQWVYSDETVDRAGDIVRQNWELANYKQNPVILWGHAFGADSVADEPIGRSVELGVAEKQLVGTIEFAVGESERAARIYRLASAGFIRAGSVGFRPLEVRYVEDQTEREKLGLGRWGAVYERSELLEFSLCAIPCNPNAVQNAVKSRTVESADADLLAALTDPTEREMEKLLRRRARSWVALTPAATDRGAPASKHEGRTSGAGDDAGSAPFAIVRADDARELTSCVSKLADSLAAQALALDAYARAARGLTTSITDLSARLATVDSVQRPVSAGAGLTAEDAEKIQLALSRLR